MKYGNKKIKARTPNKRSCRYTTFAEITTIILLVAIGLKIQSGNSEQNTNDDGDNDTDKAYRASSNPSGETRQNVDDDACNDTNKNKTYGIFKDLSGEARRSRDNKDVIKASGKTRRKEYNLVFIVNNRTNNIL